MSDDAVAKDKTVVQRLKGRVVALAQAPAVRQLAGGLAWNLGAVAVERLIGLIQAFYVARLLGIEAFGKYGLVFVTIGLLSSLIGLQLGLTASVHVARTSRTDPARAAAVMRLCEVLSFALGLAAFTAVMAAPGAAAQALLGDVKYSDIVLAGAAIACLSVVSGVQEGILQGLEQFRLLAVLRAGVAAASFALLLALARPGDLFSVVSALTLGVVLRTIAIAVAKETIARARGMVARWADIWLARGVVVGFSIPSVLASLVGGAANWYGFYLVAQIPGGFREVAVLTAGQQWRGLAMYLTTIAAGVAIPMMSRLSGQGDASALRQVHSANLWANVVAACMFMAGLGVFAGAILQLYGEQFGSGRLAFWMTAATAVPAIFANIYFQYLVSLARLWQQLGYYLIQSLFLVVGYMLFVPVYGALGFAVWTGIVGLVLCILLSVRVSIGADGNTLGKDDG